jgi:hypothetical protein
MHKNNPDDMVNAQNNMSVEEYLYLDYTQKLKDFIISHIH